MNKCLICYDNDLEAGLFYHEGCSRKVFGTNEAPLIAYTLDEMKELARKIVRTQFGITGVQPKISLGLQKAKEGKGRLTLMTGDYILKPPAKRFPEMPEMEDLTMHLAAMAGIKTVPHALIPLASGELAYITKRIDRIRNDKIHMEDLCQLAGLLTEDKYKSSMERVGKIMKANSQVPGLDLVNLFELTLFCFVTGNNDMHLKNFSLINDKGQWHLSPAYDLLNVNLVNPADDEESALTINGKKKRIKKSDFDILARHFQLNEQQTKNAYQKIRSASDEMVGFIEKGFISDESKKAYKEMLKLRIAILN